MVWPPNYDGGSLSMYGEKKLTGRLEEDGQGKNGKNIYRS
jgi:hypothetical protein